MEKGHIVQLFFNRTAGGHCEKRLADLASGFEAGGARVILTECGPGNPVAIAAEASHVCALGGDGTVRHVAHAVARCGRPLPLGVYPAGTVNLLHREIGSPLDPALYVARALGTDGAALHYPVELNDTIFLACASVGPDSRAVAGVSARLKWRIGKLAYVVAFLKLLVGWRRDQIIVECDGRALACEAFYVAKGRFFAGPWSFAPDARLASPRLHLVALERARRRDYARFLWALWRGRRIDALPGVTALDCTSFAARSDALLPVQADGDIVAALPIEVRLRDEPMAFC
jgi:diacylglycerol kinase (ATP)